MSFWGLGIVGAGLLLALVWIGALVLFPDRIARAFGPISAPSAATSDHPTTSAFQPTGTVLALTATPTRPTTLTPTPTPHLSPTNTTQPEVISTPPARVGLSIPSQLIIPAIDLDAPVAPVSWTLIQQGDGAEPVWDVASMAVGWHINSARPGQAGNVVLAGHHNIEGMVFRDLHTLQRGDTVLLIAGQIAHTYSVDVTMIVSEEGASEAQREENARWIGPFPDRRLTMVTCWPAYDNTHRVIVVALPLGPDAGRLPGAD